MKKRLVNSTESIYTESAPDDLTEMLGCMGPFRNVLVFSKIKTFSTSQFIFNSVIRS